MANPEDDQEAMVAMEVGVEVAEVAEVVVVVKVQIFGVLCTRL